MSSLELPLGTLDPNTRVLAHHVRLATDLPEAGSSGQILVSQGPDLPARFLPNGTSPPNAHVLATTTGLGAQHTTTGLTAGQVLRASGATTAQFQRLTAADVDPGTFPTGNYTFGGTTTFQGQIASTVLTGTAPLTIQSTTLVTNLNADLLDGLHESAFGLLGVARTWTAKQTMTGGLGGPFTIDGGAITVNPGPLIVGADPGGNKLVRAVSGRFGGIEFTGVDTDYVGAVDPRYLVGLGGSYRWLIGGGEEMRLNATELVPGLAGGLTLGTVSLPWGASFFNALMTIQSGGLQVTAGNVGVQTAPFASQLVRAAGTISSLAGEGYGVVSGLTVDSATTTLAAAGWFKVTTPAAVFTLPTLIGVQINDATKGAGSTISTQYGVKIENQTQGATNFALYTGSGLVRFGDDVTLEADRRIGTTSNASWRLMSNNVTRWDVRNDGHLHAFADNVYDIGASGVNRPRTGYFATSVNVGGGRATITSPGGDGTATVSGDGVRIAQFAGIGAVEVFIGSTSNHDFSFRTNNLTRWVLDASGHLVTNVDNIYDIGRVGANRPRDILSGRDVVIGTLGRFDGTDTPNDGELLVYQGPIAKWQAHPINFVVGTGDFHAALLSDNTAIAYVLETLSGVDGAVNAPGTPTVTAKHESFELRIPGSYVKTANFKWFRWETCVGASCVSWSFLANTTSLNLVHSRLTQGQIRRYQVLAESFGATVSAFATTGDSTVIGGSDTEAFGGIIAGNIAVVDMAALTGDMGVLKVGQVRNLFTNPTAMLNFGGKGVIPSSVLNLINFGTETIPGTVQRYLNLNGIGAFLKHERLEFNFDGSVRMYQTSAQPLFKLDSADFLFQNDLASPTHGILLDGTRPVTWKRYLDLVDGVLTIKDDQATPVTRVQVGKVAAGAQDYGLQVFDHTGATVMDFTGGGGNPKRILAVPVQASVDSGESLTVDLSTGLTQQIRLTGTATITLNNPVNGSRYRMWFQQDTVGSRPFPTIKGATGDEIVMFTNDVSPTLTTTPGAFDLFEFEYRTTPTARFSCMPLQTNMLLPTPVVTASPTATSFNTLTTNHFVNMPASVTAGHMLLMFFAMNAATTVTTPTGWTALTGGGPLVLFAKVADGTEGGTTVNVQTSATRVAAAQVYQLRRWLGTTSGWASAGNTGAPGTSGDPPSLTPGWAVDRTLWWAAVGINALNTITDPANYGNFFQTDATDGGSNHARLRAGRRILYATSEDPGAFSWSGSLGWGVSTVAVRPPA